MKVLIIGEKIFEVQAVIQSINAAYPQIQCYSLNNLEAVSKFLEHTKCDAIFLCAEMDEVFRSTLEECFQNHYPPLNTIFVADSTQYMQEAFSIHASGYLQRPFTKEQLRWELENLRYPKHSLKKKIRIQTFGKFQVFLEEKPVHFRHSKAKELFALLVDRRGAALTSTEIAAVLWEDKEYNRSLKNMVQNVIVQMRTLLKELEMERIILKEWNSIAINTSEIDCDYYRFIEGDEVAINSFGGEYMTEYSWAEVTCGILYQRGIHNYL